jgi:PAS domain S-box-containing protein
LQLSSKTSRIKTNKKAGMPQEKADGDGVSNNAFKDSLNWSLVALESAPFGVMVHNEKGQILMYNHQLEKISGYRKDEIPDIQTWISKLYPDPDYRRLVLEERKRKIPIHCARLKIPCGKAKSGSDCFRKQRLKGS